MRHFARYSFGVAAGVSVLVFAFVTWLCWGEGRELGVGPIQVLGHEGNATFIAGNFRAATTGTRTVHWKNLYGGFANNGRFAFAQIPRWLVLASASILPLTWLVVRVANRRRSQARGFEVESSDG